MNVTQKMWKRGMNTSVTGMRRCVPGGPHGRAVASLARRPGPSGPRPGAEVTEL